MKRNNPTNAILSSVTIVINGLLAILNFSEWYVVKVQIRTAEYPFGSEGSTPYYYKTAELYSTVTLIWGIVFLTVLIFTTWTILTRKKKWTNVAFGMTIILFLGLLIHGQIGAN